MTTVSSKKESHEEEDHKNSIKYAKGIDVYLLGIAIVIGGQVFSWNASLAAGFWEAFLGMAATGIAYVCLVFCIAEMTSALPFSGGSYGFVRVCIGPFFGYLIGCCEALQNIAYVASSVIPFGQMLTIVFNAPIDREPIYWVFFFLTALTINILGGNVFWQFSRYIGLISLLVILFYIASTSQYGDFNAYSSSSTTNYHFNVNAFMTNLPTCAWYYIGVESLPLTCVDCAAPATEIPYAMVACVLTLFVTAVGVFFTSVSQSPGIDELSSAGLPLNYGFQRLFSLSDDDSRVTWLALPATYATGFGFMFIYGRQMCSMARSGLFPKIFQLRTNSTRSPYAALLFGSLLAVIGMVAVYYTDITYFSDIFFLCILASNTIYISVLLCYIVFKVRYDAMQRVFVSPLGYTAALYGVVFYTLGIISVLGFQDRTNIPLAIFGVYVCLLIIYYYIYGYQTQKLSEEEQKVMFRAYVINANVIKRKKTKMVVGPSTRSSVESSGLEVNHHGSGVGKRVDWRNESLAVAMFDRRKSVVPEIPEEGGDQEKVDDDEDEEVSFEAKRNENPPAAPTDISSDSPKDNDQVNSEPVIREDSSSSRFQAHRPGIVSGTWNHNKVMPFHFSSSNKSSIREPMASTSREMLTRRSMTQSLSEKFQEIVQQIKFVPLMKETDRHSYEELVLADMTGLLQSDTKPSSVKLDDLETVEA